jgi:deoxyadenosine/deoxycytidine kinase
MNKLIALVGPSGVGKTSLLRALSAGGGFSSGLEAHAGRPFQSLFERDKRYAFANQMDYLLYRAEQERELRASSLPGLTDGGLDMDFHGFTRLFQARGWLNQDEFLLCKRFYQFTRSFMPPPDLVILLSAAQPVIRARLASRERINIASEADAAQLAGFLHEWLGSLPTEHVLRLDVSDETPEYADTARRVRESL